MMAIDDKNDIHLVLEIGSPYWTQLTTQLSANRNRFYLRPTTEYMYRVNR
jgi:hypothetical protein